MKHKLESSIYILVGLLLVASCNNEAPSSNGSSHENPISLIRSDTIAIKDSIMASPQKEVNPKIKSAKAIFSQQHLDSFFWHRDIYKTESWIEKEQLDSLIQGYTPPGSVCLLSDQHDLYGFNIFTIINHFEICDQQATLIITDSTNKLLDSEKIAEGGGCDLPRKSSTVFLSDTSFRRTEYPDLTHLILDSADAIGEKYPRVTTCFYITQKGVIEITEQKVDTLIAN